MSRWFKLSRLSVLVFGSLFCIYLYLIYQSYRELMGMEGAALAVPMRWVFTRAFYVFSIIWIVTCMWKKHTHGVVVAVVCLGALGFVDNNIRFLYSSIDHIRFNLHKEHYASQINEAVVNDDELKVSYWGGFGFLTDGVWYYLIHDDTASDAESAHNLLKKWEELAPARFKLCLSPGRCGIVVENLSEGYYLATTSCGPCGKPG